MGDRYLAQSRYPVPGKSGYRVLGGGEIRHLVREVTGYQGSGYLVRVVTGYWGLPGKNFYFISIVRGQPLLK